MTTPKVPTRVQDAESIYEIMTGRPSGFRTLAEAEEYYNNWPIFRCSNCEELFRDGSGIDRSGPCPFCAEYNQKGQPVQFHGMLHRLTLEECEPVLWSKEKEAK